MQVIYRMRGLLGDATEDMVNSLDNNTQEDVDKEEVFRMANVLSLCDGDGLKVMLNRYATKHNGCCKRNTCLDIGSGKPG